MDDPSQLQQHSDDHPGSASHPESGSGFFFFSKSSTWTSSSSVGNSPQNVTYLPNPQTESSTRKRKESMEDHTATNSANREVKSDEIGLLMDLYALHSKTGRYKSSSGQTGQFSSVFKWNVEGPSDGVDIEILRVSHWIWGEEIESDQDQHSKCLSDDDDVDGDDHVHTKDSMPKDSPSKGDEDGPSDIPQWVMDNRLHE
ncbi:hypothetical protein Tco_0347427 [Tanacetum coccineum]